MSKIEFKGVNSAESPGQRNKVLITYHEHAYFANSFALSEDPCLKKFALEDSKLKDFRL